MASRRRLRRALVLLAAQTAVAAAAMATLSGQSPAFSGPTKDQIKASIDLGLSYLRWHQDRDGSWGGDVATTALALRAFLESHRRYIEEDGPFIRGPIAFLRQQASGDVAFQRAERPLDAAATTVLALKASGNADGDAAIVDRAKLFLLASLADHARRQPDLYSLFFVSAALSALRLPADHSAWTRIVSTVERPAHRTDTSTRAGASPPGTADLVCVQLYCLLKAGVDRTDARVRGALDRLRAGYALDRRPGANEQGRYHYYFAAASALDAYGEPIFTDAGGVARTWQTDLARTLIERQAFDGSWVGHEAFRGEHDALVATSLALSALEIVYNQR